MAIILEVSHREFRPFITGAPGIQSVLPIIVTEHGVLDQFARYMHMYRHKSRSWQEGSTFAVRLLLEYMEVNQCLDSQPRALFMAFSEALYSGTVSNYIDTSGLWWHPRQPQDARRLIGYITHFTDWLAKVNEENKLQLNPWRQATRHEERLNWAAFSHRRDNAFLSHLWSSDAYAGHSRTVRPWIIPEERQTPAKAFPEEHFELLVLEGFRRRARDSYGSVDLRNVLISYLMHFGGLRLSEALSLWSDDVTIERGEVIVRVYHPLFGLAPDGKANRATHLQLKYGLQPRIRLVKANNSLFLGWKNCLITDPYRYCFEVLFYPSEIGQVFAGMWRDYHLKQREKPRVGEMHPYAFTNKNGQPYSHRMFRKAHKLAIERVGLAYGKIEGTTPHGHRHAYGQRLALNGASPLLIKNAMHHASIVSGQTYTQPTTTQTRQILFDMDERLRLQHIDGNLDPNARD